MKFVSPALGRDITVVVDLVTIDYGCWEVMKVVLSHPNIQPVMLGETQFVTLFPDGQDILNNAFEYAAQKEQDRGGL